MKMKTSGKKLFSMLLALVFVLGLMTALPVSADGITVTVDGQPYVAGSKICAVSTVVLELPEPVAAATNITFWEQSKTPATAGGTDYPWFQRNCTGALNGDGDKFTVTFARGDISSNSTYKFEIETDATSEGAEYIFTFSTCPEVDGEGKTIYFAENFKRYQNFGANGNWNFKSDSAGTVLPYNMDPFRKGYGYVSTSDYVGTSYTSVVDDTTQLADGTRRGRAFRAFANGGQLANFGVNPQYSASVDSLSHAGELTVVIEPKTIISSNNATKFGVAGLWFVPAEDATTGKVTVSVYGETTNLPVDSYYGAFDLNKVKLLTTVEFDSASDYLLHKHTVNLITNTTQTVDGVSTRQLVQAKLNGDVIWQRGVDGSFTFANSQAGNSGKGTPWRSTLTNEINRTILVAHDYGNVFYYYMEYKDFFAEDMNLTSFANNYAENGTLSWTFDQEVAAGSVENGLVFERKTPGTDTWRTMEIAPFLSCSADKKTIIATFDNGDLTVGCDYRVKLTTDATTALGGALLAGTDYTTFTAANPHYYMSENFEQYPVGYSYAGSPSEPAPFVYRYGWHGNSAATQQSYEGIYEDENGDKYLHLLTSGTVKTWCFDDSYAASLPAGENGHRGIFTFTIGFDDVTGSLLDVAGVGISPKEDGSFSISVRNAKIGYIDPNNIQMSSYEEIGTYTSGKAAFDATEKLTVVVDREVLKSNNNTGWKNIIYSVTVNGTKVGNIPAEGLVLPSLDVGDGIMYNSSVITWDNNPIFMYHGVGADTSVTPAKGRSSYVRIYDISYCDALAVDAAQEGTTLSFTVKNETESTIAAIPVLAIYNVDGLVRVDGLNSAATSVAAGASQTFTKAVTASENGYTYKFMLLNSKDALQPLWYATNGAIN